MTTDLTAAWKAIWVADPWGSPAAADHLEGQKAAVRILVLAALDAFWEADCYYPGCDHPCTTCPREALYKKVESLRGN